MGGNDKEKQGWETGGFISNHPIAFIVLCLVSTMVAVCSIPIVTPLFLPDWVTDTGVSVFSYDWLDNRRIVVWRRPEDVKLGSPGGNSEYVLWTDGPDGGSVTPIESIDDIVGPGFCNGSGSNWNSRTKRREWHESAKEGLVYNNFVCAETPIPDSAKGRFVFALKPGHGVLSEPMGSCKDDCESDYWKWPYRWHADDGSGRVVELPYEDRSLSLSSVDVIYAPFLDAYLAKEERYEKGVDCQFAWWIRPGPRFERFCAAPRRWGDYIFPTKLGVGTNYVAYEPYYWHLKNGVYLAVNNRFVRLISGFVDDFKVSPNGCRIALGHSRRLNQPSNSDQISLHVIDLCAHEDAIRDLDDVRED